MAYILRTLLVTFVKKMYLNHKLPGNHFSSCNKHYLNIFICLKEILKLLLQNGVNMMTVMLFDKNLQIKSLDISRNVYLGVI